MIKHFVVSGVVRNVMFRQTIIRAAQKRRLKAGASNIVDRYDTARFALEGTEKEIQEFVDWATRGKTLNSWGAYIENIREEGSDKSITDYQVNTDNVDDFRWNPDIEMYI